MMETIVQIKGLSKKYKNAETVSQVDMNITKGEIYGFLGPNGAGKTTIMKMILNLVKPTSGEIVVANEVVQKDSYQYLENVGSIIEYPVFYERLTARENLELHCDYIGHDDKSAVDEVLDIVGLSGVGDKKTNEFSLGMKQRLGIARAIITRPEVLLLDEPINGLDPVGIKDIRELLLQLKEELGVTILISSHIVSEIESIADTIGIIDHGKLLKEIKMDDIRKENAEYLEISVDNVERASEVIRTELGITAFSKVDDHRIRITDENVSQAKLSKELIMHDILMNNIEQKKANLEEYFLKLINGGAAHV